MAIKANVNTDANGNIILHMSGGLDYATNGTLENELKDLAKDNPRCTITLDLHHLEFVGSSGIGQFVQALNIMNKESDHIKLINVKPEFLRVFKLYHLNNLERLLADFDSDETEQLSQNWGARGRTFEN